MPAQIERDVSVPVGDRSLDAELVLPSDAIGLVAFAAGSGVGQPSPRTDALATALRDQGCGTLLFDLLTDHEGRVPRAQFDVTRMTNRLVAATAWLRDREETRDLPLAYVGTDTGAAAALSAAARLGDEVEAVVSRGGRVDLVTEPLADVRAPTLLVVGSDDTSILALNRAARPDLGGPAELVVVDGAGHRFERPDDLATLAEQTASWVDDHLG